MVNIVGTEEGKQMKTNIEVGENMIIYTRWITFTFKNGQTQPLILFILSLSESCQVSVGGMVRWGSSCLGICTSL